MSGDVCFRQKVLWYEAVVVDVVVDDERSADDGGSDGNGGIVTLWDLHEEIRETRTRITVSASYPGEGRSVYSVVSEGVVEAMATTVSLWEGVASATETGRRMGTGSVVRIGQARPTGFLGGGLESEGQVVLG
ncbi:hypothetical protein BJX70DRAFT_245677 [Aspergillus crustosus]